MLMSNTYSIGTATGWFCVCGVDVWVGAGVGVGGGEIVNVTGSDSESIITLLKAEGHSPKCIGVVTLCLQTYLETVNTTSYLQS